MQNKIKLFAMSNQMTERALDYFERETKIDLGREIESSAEDKDNQYYPQFQHNIRVEAKEMALHYEIFYCLEVSIRNIVKEKLRSELGESWWDVSDIPENIKKM